MENNPTIDQYAIAFRDAAKKKNIFCFTTVDTLEPHSVVVSMNNNYTFQNKEIENKIVDALKANGFLIAGTLDGVSGFMVADEYLQAETD